MARFPFYLICFLPFSYLHSQCCGGCNPIGGNTNQGTLPKYTLQVNTYLRNAYSQGYMEQDHRSDFQFVKNGNSNYTGLQVGYGITKRFTADVETGYYINRTQNFDFYGYKNTLTGYGFSSATFSGKYNIIKDTVHEFEFTGGIGIRVPLSSQPMVVDGVELSEDVQPCNGAYGIVLRSFIFKEFDKPDVRVFLMTTVSMNNTNIKNYKEGNTYINALFFSKTIYKKLSGIFQIRNEIREHAYRDNILVPSSGGMRFVFVPQLNFRLKEKYNISALYELPVYQYYNGIQLKDVYAFSINLNVRLGLSKKANAVCVKPN